MKTLVTKRLILRPLVMEDALDFFRYARKPHIGPMAGWAPHTSLEESKRILQMMINDNEVLGITLKPENRIIGTIGLHAINLEYALENKREIGYVIDDLYWGKGLTVEAVKAMLHYGFVEIELDMMLCGHAKDNVQSKRVIEKCGFVYSHMDQRKHFDGTMIDILVYQMTVKKYKEVYHDTFENEIRL